MRKISTILVVLVMLAMCTSSFGYILVYNVSTTVKGVNAVTRAGVTVPLKGYLVLNLDADGNFVDANLLLYGNDSNTPIKQKVYAQLNSSDAAHDLGANVWNLGDYIFVRLEGSQPWDFEILLSGKTKLRAVGNGSKLVASSIKGVNIVRAGTLLGPDGQEMSGTATASATLWTAAVKAINDPCETWTQEEVIVTGKDLTEGHQLSLIERLTKKYSPAELP